MSSTQSSILIRAAISADLSQIQSCAVEAYTPYISVIGKAPAPMVADFESQISEGIIDVAIIENRVIGYVVHFQKQTDNNRSCQFIENIAVTSAVKGQGIGTLLMQHVEHTAQGNSLMLLRLYTNAKMEENLIWYPKLGFSETKRLHENGFDRVYFEKLI